jgi:hypothetical protein
VALDRNAGRIDDVTFDAAGLQRATDPERVLAGLVAHDGAYAGRQRALVLVPVDQVQHGLQPCCGLRLRDRVDGGLLAPAVVQRDLPLRGSKLE